MKKQIETPATGSNESFIFPITMGEVNSRLSAFKGNPPEALSQAHGKVDSARREAVCEIKAARIKLDIRKLDFETTLAAEAKGKLVLALSVEMEGIHACRKIGKIFDELHPVAEILEEAVCAAKASAATAEGVAALERRITELQARMSVEINHAKIGRLGNNLRSLVEVVMHGKWKEVPTSDQVNMLQIELTRLASSGLYTGEATKAAAKERISEIEQELELLREAENNQLNDDEHTELREALGRIPKMRAELLEEESVTGMNSATARAAQEKFTKQFEAALISAEGIVAVYQINCERLALGLAG